MVKSYSHCQYTNFYTVSFWLLSKAKAFSDFKDLIIKRDSSSLLVIVTKVFLKSKVIVQQKPSKKYPLISPDYTHYHLIRIKKYLTFQNLRTIRHQYQIWKNKEQKENCVEISVLTMRVTFYHEVHGFSKVIGHILSQIMDQKGPEPMSWRWKKLGN